MNKWEPLLQYCKTDRQRQIIQLRADGVTAQQIADDLGLNIRSVMANCARVRQIAASKGWSPEHDMVHGVPDGFKLRGVSTYYNADGVPSGQWVKSQTDNERQREILLESIDKAHESFEPFQATPKPAGTNEDLLTLVTITDYHLGMYAWEAETGDDWDITIARGVFLNALADMIESSPRSHYGLFCQLGDFLHFDSLLQVTPSSGHILDADSRYAKLVELTIEVMTQAVKMMLERFGKVIVVQAEGNHDMAGSIWLRKHIKHVFSQDDRVEVIDNEFPYYAYLHGEIMLGFHHGHKVRLPQLHKLFSSEPRFREMWGKAKQTYIHCGHLHHERVVEDAGAITEQHPTLSGRDAYAARGGWVSARGAKVITYDKVDGEVHRTTVRPR